MSSVEDKIKLIFKDLKVQNPREIDPLYGFRNILLKNFDPPVYIVRLIFIDILKLKDYGKMDRVWWHTYFRFQGYDFKIRDYKFGSWTLEVNCEEKYIIRKEIKPGIFFETIDEDSDLYKVSLLILSKLKKAAKILIPYFKNEYLDDSKIENYYIYNTYEKLESIYLFFKNRLELALQKYNSLLVKKDNTNFRKKLKIEHKVGTPLRDIIQDIGDPLSKLLNEFNFSQKLIENHNNEIEDGKVKGFIIYDRYAVIIEEAEKEISNFSFALITIFFSILEFILEIFYLFQNRKIGLKDFKSKSWDFKFKYIFPIQNDKGIKKLYDAFREIKSKYRNPLSHGLLNEINYLIPVPLYGLKPISYEYLTDKIHYRDIPIKKEDAIQLKNNFDDFLNYIKKITPYNYYVLFLKFGFPVPIKEDKIKELKSEMTSIEEFLEYLMDRSEYENAIINREIF